MNADVIIIGAGLSGLACALSLRERGLEPLIVEAADGVGGRVRTDQREGFQLDRGFQVLQTWYPQARELLDYDRLDLRAFYPGALVRTQGRLHRVSDVWRKPTRLPEMLLSPIGTLSDKLTLLGLRRRCLRGDLEALYGRPESTAIERLRALGFSTRMIESFFKPFFSGVFFEPDLDVSSRTFEFVFRAFALGDTALPARGMGEIPAQLAARLPSHAIRLGAKVERVAQTHVHLQSGERLKARAVVIATEAKETARLLHQPFSGPPGRGTTCFYFGAHHAPIQGPYLVLNGEGRGRINSMLFPSNLSEYYAPPGRSLITVNVHGTDDNPDALETRIRSELYPWMGEQVRDWRRIAVYRLPTALTAQHPPVPYPGAQALRRTQWVWSCGEYQSAPSIQWALHSGRRAGVEVAAALEDAAVGHPSDRKHPTH
ncbi:FAD-dependent oxidoreductase [Thiorhodococcus mannitoliphagus]|uniref:FAD-dependent oxidoreductase n=1 Tax=Thiorhodococcus mannitoliphagus TaxID=329406 RepID=A0A6P1DT85_9GAMM|nr:NAD(P)/FAD-dependent oxidoreductase [Thiorhodococcus mannitoliphagus]NEX20151.1 FAD-dependent oxidoreductase [Thiorhodococcus mannitoliphagus]